MVWCEKLGKYTGHWNIETMLQIQLGAFDLDRILGETHTHTQSLALNQDFLSTLNIMHDVQHAILTAIVRTPLLEKNNAV